MYQGGSYQSRCRVLSDLSVGAIQRFTGNGAADDTIAQFLMTSTRRPVQATLGPIPAPTPAPVVPSGPWEGTPSVIPGTIEAEEFDLGGEGLGYSDSDAGNNGGVRA